MLSWRYYNCYEGLLAHSHSTKPKYCWSLIKIAKTFINSVSWERFDNKENVYAFSMKHIQFTGKNLACNGKYILSLSVVYEFSLHYKNNCRLMWLVTEEGVTKVKLNGSFSNCITSLTQQKNFKMSLWEETLFIL